MGLAYRLVGYSNRGDKKVVCVAAVRLPLTDA